MTANDFNQFWTSTYPDTALIPHIFRHRYPDRWFRIHSLPESKRCAQTPQQWAILLERQNAIITDLLGCSSKIMLVTNTYGWQGDSKAGEREIITDYNLTLLDKIALHQLYPDQYDEGQFIIPAFSEQVWQPQKFDELLKAIAQDELTAFFVAKNGDCLIAPYDGGVDLVMKDEATRNKFKHKYSDWLSARADGL